MSLTTIKLVGFKSFVDPTAVKLHGNLTAIVGPNGCGKSNIIDAVRWVMGESSAKHLRGESMSDVIFNGSATRKPIGQASIELIFDNSDAKFGAAFAKYSQLSIKRLVTRDGQSNYFLNGSRCRRRDIIDIFLGTGLGPRSYAIIMQNTISRIIEAKPDELREFLEEAAGIVKYKERRRETENRIRHTRENLDRLGDLRQELEQQLNHLQRQAKKAKRYKELKEEERFTKAQLYTVQWSELNKQVNANETLIRKIEIELEAVIATQRSLDATLESKRDEQISATDTFNDIQKNYYAIGAEIARLEQTKQDQQVRREQLQKDYVHTQSTLEIALKEFKGEQEKISELKEKASQLEPQKDKAQATTEEANNRLTEAEREMQLWQAKWDEFNELYAKTLQQAEVEQTRIRYHEQRQNEVEARLTKLEKEKEELVLPQIDTDLIQLEDAIKLQQTKQTEQQSRIDEIQNEVLKVRDQNHEINYELDQERTKLGKLRGRQASLEALQQAALGQKEKAATDWLQQHALDKRPRVAQRLKVEKEWRAAVEIVLGKNLEAVCIDSIEAMADQLSSFSKGHLFLVEKSELKKEPNAEHLTLASKVKADQPILDWLANIMICDSLSEALQVAPSLQPHQSVITREGIWLGKNWLRIHKEQDATGGVIQRQEELEETQQTIKLAMEQVANLEKTLSTGRQQLHELEQQLEQERIALREVTAQLTSHQTQSQLIKAEITNQQNQALKLDQRIKEFCDALEQIKTALVSSRKIWQDALEKTEQQSNQKESLIQQRSERRERLDDLRQEARKQRESAHQLLLEYREVQTQLELLVRNLQNHQAHITAQTERCESLQTDLSNMKAPIEKVAQQLEETLHKQLKAEEGFKQAKNEVGNIDSQLRDLDKARHATEETIQGIKDNLQDKRIGNQNIIVRRSTLEEKINEVKFDFTTLLENISGETTLERQEETLSNQLEQLTRRIERLGAINLAAIDECEAISERKSYLDAQDEDLQKALTTLEDAIKKIDRETRSRFKNTYDQVNENFKKLFPKLFGSGSASLELTDDDLLQTGINVIARPPGKRLTNLHLLSGGEKALTALAFVFSLFLLNPAPFCMLDEVDAPLDDANIERFCNLVREMSKTVQFIFISHNKLAIEMADVLMGVTMNEPGVSRLVSVNMQEAVEMIEA